MESYSEEKIEYLSRPTNFIRKCINCGSLFITERECEACGYQLKDQDLGVPVGEGSFYSLREEFHNKQNFLEKIFFKQKGRKYKEFRNRLLHRYNSLIKGMESPWDDLNKWNYFHFELIDLTKYLASFSSNKIIMERILISIRNHPFYHEIKLANESGSAVKSQKELIPVREKKLLLIFVIPVFLIILAPWVFKLIR